jgi:hypothetical protein
MLDPIKMTRWSATKQARVGLDEVKLALEAIRKERGKGMEILASLEVHPLSATIAN